MDDSAFTYLPEYAHLKTADNGRITLRHMLSFSSGYDWNEFVYGFDDPRDSHYQMFRTSDPIGHLLDRSVVSTPGSTFHCNSGDTNVLGEIVRKTSSSATLVTFARQFLFGPLGINAYEWLRFPLADSVTFASGGASLRPRDMAKLGALYLSGGVWRGERIVPQQWVEVSTEQAVPLVGDYGTLYGYGFNWWLGCFSYRGTSVDYFRASRWGGQYVYVLPELDLIVVLTSGAYYEAAPIRAPEIIEDYVLAAIVD